MMYISGLKLAVATLLVACGAFFVPVISGHLSRGDHGHIASAEPTGAEPELDELIRTIEAQLREGDREAVNRTRGRLNTLIDARRRDCRTHSDPWMPTTHDIETS